MSDTHEITVAAPAQIAAPAQKDIGLTQLMQLAMEDGIDVDKLERIIGFYERAQDRKKEEAYARAMVELKKELPTYIEHDKKVDFINKKGYRTKYSYASMAAAYNAIVPHLSEFGFSHACRPETTTVDKVTVTCILTHRDGHSEKTTLSSPPDTSGGKGPAQAVSSTITLLSRYLFLSLLGVATADMGEPHGPPGPDSERVDPTVNLRAVSFLQQRGITLDTAVAHVGGKRVEEWSEADLAKLRELAKSKKEPRPVLSDIETAR